MRKSFNFYKSYYDVMLELDEKDQLLFIRALLDRQFYGIEPKFTGVLKLAWISQKHSIDKQIKGFEDKLKCTLTPPTEGGTQGGMQGGMQGGTQDPLVQLKEKEKEKEEVKEEKENIKEKEKKFNKNLPDKNSKYFFYIENELFEMKFSRYIVENHRTILEALCLKNPNKKINTEHFSEKINAETVGYQFSNVNHVINFFKKFVEKYEDPFKTNTYLNPQHYG